MQIYKVILEQPHLCNRQGEKARPDLYLRIPAIHSMRKFFFFLLVLLCDVYVMVCVGWWAYCSGVHAKAMLCYVCEVGFW